MQTSTKICKYQVTTTLKMSIGYLQIFTPIFRTFYRISDICRFLPPFFVLSTAECDNFYLQIFANS